MNPKHTNAIASARAAIQDAHADVETKQLALSAAQRALESAKAERTALEAEIEGAADSEAAARALARAAGQSAPKTRIDLAGKRAALDVLDREIELLAERAQSAEDELDRASAYVKEAAAELSSTAMYATYADLFDLMPELRDRLLSVAACYSSKHRPPTCDGLVIHLAYDNSHMYSNRPRTRARGCFDLKISFDLPIEDFDALRRNVLDAPVQQPDAVVDVDDVPDHDAANAPAIASQGDAA